MSTSCPISTANIYREIITNYNEMNKDSLKDKIRTVQMFLRPILAKVLSREKRCE